MITDEVFRIELDKSLKAQGIKKAERNVIIERALLTVDCEERDRRLENERALIPEKETVPLESHEQKQFVAWFKKQYPGVIILNIKNDNAKQHDVEMGVYPGASDLFIPEFRCFVEMKRTKGYKVSDEQLAFANHMDALGYYYVLGIGFEDARNKIIKLFVAK